MASIAPEIGDYAPRRPLQAKPPSRFWTYAEGRAMFELAAFYASMPMLSGLPRGDGHSVLVLPGFMATNTSTAPMRRLLGGLGYDAHGWESGRNLKVNEAMLRSLDAQLTRLYEQTERKVSIIGWSLGGVLAREIAKLHPEKVRLVVSLGSPLSNDRSYSSASHLFELLNGREPDLIQPGKFDALHEAPPVPTTSILTKTDGIVHWHASVQEEGEHPSENIVVYASHCGLGVNPSVMIALADRLSQAEGEWEPFTPTLAQSWMYPDLGLD